jgi:Raf kinase inhibitor-like YbhB/YbcL family protein
MMYRARIITPVLVGLAVAVLIAGCGSSTPTPTLSASTGQDAPSTLATGGMELHSAAFEPGGAIPEKYTCTGEDVSPALQWSDPPSTTASFALIVDDPDAPGNTWVHWVLYDLPADARGLPESVSAEPQLAGGGVHGNNSWGRLGYGGPCPPSGTHRYFFKLYALDTNLDLAAGAPKEQVTQAMEGHILAQAELLGTFTHQ